MAIEDGQFKKGHGGGPGRPAKSETYSDTLRDILQAKEIDITYTFVNEHGEQEKKVIKVTSDKNMYYGVAAAQINEALQGSVQAQKEIVDRIQGKAPQTLTVAGEVENLDDKLERLAKLVDGTAESNSADRPITDSEAVS